MATKTDRISIRLGPKLRERLEEIAYGQEMALGELIRHVLITYVALEAPDESD